MKGLTLHQPWAELIAWGIKLVETRSWPTTYRGWLAIHTGKSKTQYNQMMDRVRFSHVPQDQWRSQLAYYYHQHLMTIPMNSITPIQFGSIIAVANLYDVVPVETIRDSLSQRELAFGNYDDDRFAWMLKDVIVLPEAIPYKGFQRLWTLNEDILPDEIKRKMGLLM